MQVFILDRSVQQLGHLSTSTCFPLRLPICALQKPQTKNMEGKSLRSVYTGSLIMFLLVVGQIQVEAKAKACCRKLWSATCAENCIGYGFDLDYCAAQCGCKLTDEDQCHSRWAALPSESEEATVVDYCKMGCTSSVCNQMITDATSEVKKDNVMKYCGNACHQFCTKGAGTATATLAA